jgi:hypothetical protein
LVFRQFNCRFSGLFTVNEPKPVVKIGKAVNPDKPGQAMLRIQSRPANKKGVSMLRILQPILQLQRGSVSGGLSHKKCAKTRKKTNESPDVTKNQLSQDYPVNKYMHYSGHVNQKNDQIKDGEIHVVII